MTTKSFFHRSVLKLKQLLCGSMGSIIIMQRSPPPHTHKEPVAFHQGSGSAMLPPVLFTGSYLMSEEVVKVTCVFII